MIVALMFAATLAGPPLPASCAEVRAYVAQHGPRAAVDEARRRGWTWAQIRRAREACAKT